MSSHGGLDVSDRASLAHLVPVVVATFGHVTKNAACALLLYILCCKRAGSKSIMPPSRYCTYKHIPIGEYQPFSRFPIFAVSVVTRLMWAPQVVAKLYVPQLV